MLIEVPDLGFDTEWNKILVKVVTKHFKRKGLSRTKAIQAAHKFVEETRGLAEFRIQNASQGSNSDSMLG